MQHGDRPRLRKPAPATKSTPRKKAADKAKANKRKAMPSSSSSSDEESDNESMKRAPKPPSKVEDDAGAQDLWGSMARASPLPAAAAAQVDLLGLLDSTPPITSPRAANPATAASNDWVQF